MALTNHAVTASTSTISMTTKPRLPRDHSAGFPEARCQSYSFSPTRPGSTDAANAVVAYQRLLSDVGPDVDVCIDHLRA
jgi:hypothetical protein